MRRIVRQDVIRWLRELGQKEATHIRKGVARTLGRRLSRQTILNALNLLRRALQDAADEGHVQVNVAREVEVPKRPREDEGWTYLTADEIAALLAAKAPHRATAAARTIFTVAIYTGLRAGELWGLRWSDVRLDGPRPELHVRRSYTGPTKGGRPRHVPLLTPARTALVAWRRERPGVGDALVFPGKRGACHCEGYDAAFASWKRSAGIDRPVRFHDLRHTCASHLVMGTWTARPLLLQNVQKWLGHASITTTERYAHLAPDWLHGVVEERDEEGKERRR